MEASGCRIVKYGKEDAEFSIYNVADIHLLNRGISKTHLQRDIEKIKKDPYAMFFIGGDYADWIYPWDKRFDPEAFDEEIKVTELAQLAAYIARLVVQTFSPVRRKMLGMLLGNHDLKAIRKNSQMDIHDAICRELGTPNLRYSGFSDIYFVHERGFRGCKITHTWEPPAQFTSRLRVFIHHGMGAANTAGGKINKLKNLNDMVDADLVLMGHVHEQFAKAFLRLTPNWNCSDVDSKTTMGLITGSYLRTYSEGFTGYGEEKGYYPTTLGATRARYTPRDRVLTVENRADGVGLKGNQCGKVV